MSKHALRSSEDDVFPFRGPSYTAARGAIGKTALFTAPGEELMVEIANVGPYEVGMRFFIVGHVGPDRKVTFQSEDATNERDEIRYRLV